MHLNVSLKFESLKKLDPGDMSLILFVSYLRIHGGSLSNNVKKLSSAKVVSPLSFYFLVH